MAGSPYVRLLGWLPGLGGLWLRGALHTIAAVPVAETLLPSCPMPDLFAALDAFLQCGDLDGGVEAERVWMTCDDSAAIAHRVPPAGPDP
jgi:hypothetical protein